MEFDLENPLTSLISEHQSDETISSLFDDESHHIMPLVSSQADECFISIRHKVISLIVQEQFSCKFDPYVSYLAVNYMDRFISKQEFPQENPWMFRLLAISCLSLAVKMMNVDLSYLEGDKKGYTYAYDTQSVNRMEVLILTCLKWQMRPITPFSFLDFFLFLLDVEIPIATRALKHRASEIIFKSRSEIKVLEYKPSIIAASALVCASHEILPLQLHCIRYQISSCGYVDKGNMLHCTREMQDMIRKWNESTTDAVSSISTSVV